MVEREKYVKQMLNFKDKHLIKVLTGMRRSGKSTLFLLYIKKLKELGIQDKNIVYINLEDPDLMINNYNDLYNYLKVRIQNNMTYIFVDEIQNIDKFEKAIDGIYIKNNVDLYITGSNAKLLSTDLTTVLTGRYIEIKVFPFSFKEYMLANSEVEEKIALIDYLTFGGMPQLIEFEDKDSKFKYLNNLIFTIFHKDIFNRINEKNENIITKLFEYILQNAGNDISVNKIVNTLKSSGYNVTNHTIEKYLKCFEDSFMINCAKKYNVVGKSIFKSNYKYYPNDIGLSNAYIGNTNNSNIGRVLENIVYNELLRRYDQVYVGKLNDFEIDFITKSLDGITYIQVTYDISDESVLNRELKPLLRIKDQYDKILLVYNLPYNTQKDGIKIIGISNWLLDSEN